LEWVEQNITTADFSPTLLEVLHYYNKAKDITSPTFIMMQIEDDFYREDAYKAIQLVKSYGLEAVIHFLKQPEVKKIIKKDIPVIVYQKAHPEKLSRIFLSIKVLMMLESLTH